MSKRPHILVDHIELDGERYVLLDATPEQVLRWLHKHHRTQAFAAIHRSAKVARQHNRIAAANAVCGFAMDEAYSDGFAAGVRAAIRAAIGSDKA